MPRLAAHLPDPAVGLTPVLERRVDLAREQLPEAVVQAIARARVEPDRVEEHPPDIVLPVAPGVVADPHRPRALVAGEVIERLLVELRAPVDAVHDLQVLVLDPVGDEVEVVARLPVEAEGRESPQHERRVPQPAVAVVPVALAAGRLGQRGRRRGDHRSGRSVGQPLERERGPLQVDLPGMIREATAADPLVPVRSRLGEPGLRLLAGRGRRVLAPAESAERAAGRRACWSAHALAAPRTPGADRCAGAATARSRRPRRRRPHSPRRRAATSLACARSRSRAGNRSRGRRSRRGSAGPGAGRARPPSRAGRGRTAPSAPVLVMPAPDQQHVANLEPPRGRAPCRLQDHRPRQVATAGRHRPVHRPRAEPSRVTVEDRREDARPVHLRQRQPLDVPARAPRARRPRSRRAARSPQSVETDFRQGECRGPGLRRSAAPIPAPSARPFQSIRPPSESRAARTSPAPTSVGSR